MKSVVVEVRKGMVTEIYSDDENVQFVVVDWDFPEEREPDGREGLLVDPVRLEAMPSATRSLFQRIVS